MRKRIATVLACVALAAVGCGTEQETEPAVSESLTVEAFDFYFEPTSLAVEPGAEVTIELVNNGDVSHSWTSTDLDAEVEVGGAESADLTFTAPAEPGSFDFFCKFHPDEMQGTISIGGSDEPAEEEPEEGDDEDEDVDVDVDTEDEEGTEEDTTQGY